MNTVNEQVSNIIGRFDFERVEKTMAALNWTWSANGRQPTREEMIAHATHLLDTAARAEVDDWYYISSGGFTATKLSFKTGAGRLSLKCTVEESYCIPQ